MSLGTVYRLEEKPQRRGGPKCSVICLRCTPGCGQPEMHSSYGTYLARTTGKPTLPCLIALPPQRGKEKTDPTIVGIGL